MNLPKKRDENRALAKLPDNPLEGKIELDGKEVVLVRDYFEKMRYYPTAASVLECKGPSCMCVAKCPLAQLNRLPEPGTPCPVEEALAQVWIQDLVNELEIGSSDVVDQSQIHNLISLRLWEWRTAAILGKEHPVIKSFRAMALDGTPIFEEKLHPLHGLLEKNAKMSDTILQRLIATREAKSKDKTRRAKSGAEVMTDLLERVEKLKGDLGGDAIDADFEVKSGDDGS